MTKRSLDDKVIPFISRNNKARLGSVKTDNAIAPYTVVFSLKFLIPNTDTVKIDEDKSVVIYPRPVYDLKEKKIFIPVRTKDGIVLRVFWYKYLGKVKNIEARREVAALLDKLYTYIDDNIRPIIAMRIHLVDWNLGFAVEQRKLLDKWYSEKTFGGLNVDTFNLKSWGMADSAPIGNNGKRDNTIERYYRRNPNEREAFDPFEDKFNLNPVILVRNEIRELQEELEITLPNDLIKIKKLKPNIAKLQTSQIMAIIKSSYFEKQATAKLISIFMEKYNKKRSLTSDRRLLVKDLGSWLRETVRNRFLR